ncbi:hypothetical protein [Micromonospora sp. NPDC126480]|uniref:hypothetical protein n=1 Tax=Micromonospora sp. NPDC126480 TaxID=3155312 RepID=UPI00332B8EFE
MSFADYAALARLLAEQRRAGEQGAAAEAARRRDLHAAAESLRHRLTAQGQRLDQLGRAIGAQPPAGPVPPAAPADPPPPTAPGGPTAPASGDASTAGPVWAASPAPASRTPMPPGPPSPATARDVPRPQSGPPPAAPASGSGSGSPDLTPAGRTGTDPGTELTGGAAAAPVRSGVGAYPFGGVGETAPAVPGPRAGDADPAAELELARRYADEADRHGQQAELLAQRPPLLPAWSPVARALAVYAGCAAVGVVLMLVMVLASGVGVVDSGTLYAWMCAGLPAVSLIAGWLLLGRFGRAPMVAGTPPRYPLLGIAVCFLATPIAYCGYLVLFRSVF